MAPIQTHLVAAAAVAAVLARGDEAHPQIARFSAKSELVVLSATALDKKGRPVTDLGRGEFRITEDGRPQKLEQFSQGAESRLRILLLVDASGSMSGALKSASPRMAAIQLLASLSPDDEAALAGFDHRYWGIVAFTKDRQKIERGFEELEPFGSTALHDALDKAASDLASHGEGRRAVVVITDGVDTASQQDPGAVVARSRALDVPIYAVSVVSPLDDPASPRFTGRERPAVAVAGMAILKRYALWSGGAAFTVSDFAGLKQASQRIVAELKHQYRLGYDPPPGPPRFRSIAVTSTRQGVVVKTRSGYVPRS